MGRGSSSDSTKPSFGLGDIAAAALLAFAAASSSASNGDRRPTPERPDESAAAAPATSKDGRLGRIDLALQRPPVTAFPIAVIKKFGDDRAGRLAALIAYYGFFSLFPAMLALVTVLGFVLENNPDLRADIANSALGQFPIVGDSIASTVSSPLTGSTLALVIGLLGALWAGLGTVQACQDAMNEVWAVERVDYPSFVKKRLTSLAMLVLIGLMLAVSTGLTQLIQVIDLGPGTAVLVVVGSVAVAVALFMVAYRVLTVAHVTWRQAMPGAVTAGVLYSVLQYVGGLYITRTVNGATDTYGTFAVVIGLLSWIFLIAQVLLLGAEINTVAAKRMWPRSLFGEAATAGDRRSHAELATSQRMDESVDIEVDFDDPERATEAATNSRVG